MGESSEGLPPDQEQQRVKESFLEQGGLAANKENPPIKVDLWTDVLYLPQEVVNHLVATAGFGIEHGLAPAALKLKDAVERKSPNRELQREINNLAQQLRLAGDRSEEEIRKINQVQFGPSIEEIRRVAFRESGLVKALRPYVEMPDALQRAVDLKKGRGEPKIHLKDESGKVVKELDLPDPIRDIYESKYPTAT